MGTTSFQVISSGAFYQSDQMLSKQRGGLLIKDKPLKEGQTTLQNFVLHTKGFSAEEARALCSRIPTEIIQKTA
jgi:hypothetical protein